MPSTSHAHSKLTTPNVPASTIDNLYEKNVISVEPNDTILDAARMMGENHIGDVLVVEIKNGKTVPVGILTDRDIVLEVVAKEKAADSTRVSEIMSQGIVTCNESDNLADIVTRMTREGISRLPLVDDTGELVGILTSKRVFQYFAEGLCELSRISEQQQEREETKH